MTALAAARAEIHALKQQLAAQQAALSSREEQLAQLRAQIAWLKRQLFGRKSERADRRQLELSLQSLEAQVAQLEADAPSAPTTPAKPPRKPSAPRPTRQERYGHLPVLETVVIEPEEVKAEPESFERIGEEETFELEVDPPRFYRRRLVRPKYRRKADRQAPPVLAPAPIRPVEGIASIGLLVHLILAKYADHLPLFRQQRIYRRSGVELSRQSMMRWVEIVADWFKPIYGHMQKELLGGDYIQADETPIKYLDADIKAGKAQQGFLCGYSRPGGNVVFTWRTSRSTEALTDLLEDFQGLLQCDGYAAYQRFAKEHPGIELVGCMAHVRRKFEESLTDYPREAALVLRLMGHLYEQERFCRERGFSPKLVALRRLTHARPVFTRLARVIIRWETKALPKSKLGIACRYARNQWEPLGRYLEHGQVHIDNNAMERSIRLSAIGKKNWQFVGHPKAVDRPAVIYSLLGSCERFGHDPREYLTDVLERLCEEPDRFHPREPETLTPKGWKPATKSAS